MQLYYIFCVFLVILGILGLIAQIHKIQKEARKDLLEQMLKNNDINDKVYIKYLNK